MASVDERVSRRRLLKRAGVGAAVLGAGSMLTASSAAAQGDPTCIGAGGCGECTFQTTCGAGCGCVITVEGCCFCHQGISCGGATPCHHTSDCPLGWECAYTCCGGTICIPPCGFLDAALVEGSGAMSTSGAGAGAPSRSRKHQAAATEVTVMRSVSRKTLIKRAGIGAAAVGAGTMVTAASAQAAPGINCIHVGGCGPFIDCASDPHDCCGCVTTVEGCCFCMENMFCEGLHACDHSGACPPGWACATGGCEADPGFCVPPCGTASPGHAPCVDEAGVSGATWTGGGAAAHPHEEAPDEAPDKGHGHQ